jgi:catechol 2,3-dioxygenase-like lactoylglutathione lyase family enzyme
MNNSASNALHTSPQRRLDVRAGAFSKNQRKHGTLASIERGGQVFCRTLYGFGKLPRCDRNGRLMTALAHVNIRTADLDRSVAFYRDVLGLVPRPAATRPSSIDHIWMTDDQGIPCIHLQRTNHPAAEPGEHAGFHHLALACSNPVEWRRKLGSMAVDFHESDFAGARMRQFNLRDPDGILVELLFEMR